MKYKITKKECALGINGVCSMCGGKLEPLETVDNANNPTFWSGCNSCFHFDNGVSPQVYKIAKELVEKYRYKHYSHIQDHPSDSDERIEYNKKCQIKGACGIVQDVLKIYRQQMTWICKYCGENENPKCHKCVREDGKPVDDELARG